MDYNLDEKFLQDLTSTFDAAVASKAVVYNGSGSSKVVQREMNGTTVNFQITELTNLTHRPDNMSGKPSNNPFENPEPELTVRPTYGEQGEFRVVLNKFPVIPHHFLLITKKYESQNSPLSPIQLFDTIRILIHLKKSSTKNWFAFYNCGPESGASQPHKHIQFLTLPDNFISYPEKMISTATPFLPDSQNEPLQDANLPFAHFVAKFPSIEKLDKETVSMYFSSLLQAVLNVQNRNDSTHISYNVVLTTEYIMLVPRSHAKYESLGVNSCGVLGLFLCKNSQLVDMIEKVTPEKILLECGYPNSVDIKFTEYDY